MMIRINYPDGRFDMIKTSQLSRLIETGQITGFKRETGWVVLGEHPIRNQSNPRTYRGAEKRKALAN